MKRIMRVKKMQKFVCYLKCIKILQLVMLPGVIFNHLISLLHTNYSLFRKFIELPFKQLEKYSRNNKRGRGNFNPKNGFGSKFEPNHRQRGRGIARRGMGYGRRQSSPDLPPKEAFVGFSDKDMDEIYLNTGYLNVYASLI